VTEFLAARGIHADIEGERGALEARCSKRPAQLESSLGSAATGDRVQQVIDVQYAHYGFRKSG